MTSTAHDPAGSPYGTAAPAPAARAPLTGSGHAWRVAVTLLVALVAVPAAGVAAFFALIVGSGCFLSCSEANPAGGFALGVLAVALVLLAPAAARLLWHRWSAFWLAAGAQVAAGVLAASVTGLT